MTVMTFFNSWRRLVLIVAVLGLMTRWPVVGATNPANEVTVVATLNNGLPTTFVRGWPWTLRVSAFSVGATAPLAMAADGVKISVAAVGNNQPATWPWQRSTQAPSGATADANFAAVDTWVFLTAEQTSAISAGSYQVSVTWGGQQAPVTTITVIEVADAANGATDLVRARLTSQVAALQGDRARALAALDGAIAAAPNSVGLLTDKAALLEQMGRTDDALAAAEKALKLFKSQNQRHNPPPVLLLRLRDRLFAAALEQVSNDPLPGAPAAGPANANANASVSVSPAMSVAAIATNAPTPTTATTQTAAAVSVTPTTSGAASGVAQGEPSPGAVIALTLSEAEIRGTAGGQWAARAVASSRYGTASYSEKEATGAPNVSMAGNAGEAWCPATKGSGTQWLELTFAQPMQATEVRVRQNNAPGTIAKIEAIDAAGAIHIWWSGKDPFVPPRVRDIAWFTVRVPKTDYLVQKIRMTFDLSLVQDWVEVDAVQLVGSADPVNR